MLGKGLHGEVYKLYSFVKLIDGYVQTTDKAALAAVRRQWTKSKKNTDKIIDRDDAVEHTMRGLAGLVKRYDCDPVLIDRFLKSKQKELAGGAYKTLDDSLKQVDDTYGSIGQILARVLGHEQPERAISLSRALAWLEVLRQIKSRSKHSLIPTDDLVMFGLKDLSESESIKKPAEFREFIDSQISRYQMWVGESKQFINGLPRRNRRGVKTLLDITDWAVGRLADDPALLYSHKIKPSRTRISLSKLKAGL